MFNTICLTYADIEVLLLLALVHAVGGGQDVLVGDEGSSAHVPIIIVIFLIMLCISVTYQPPSFFMLTYTFQGYS